MCNTPRTIFTRVSGEFRPYVVACRKCWQCRHNRVWDWVGRAIAENETSVAAHFVTLTYGNTDRYGEELNDRARSLHYSDVQKWLKRIRKACGPESVRYVVAGEYGPLKGRSHWHALLFWKNTVPDIKLDFKYWGNRDFNTDPFWPNGLTEWSRFEPARAKYVCKYLLKAQEGDDSLERTARLSKFPPLGRDYFRMRAERYVEQGLAPQDFTYEFPWVTWGKKNPKPRTYVLQGVSAELFLRHFVKTWRAKHGRDNWPYSEIVDDMLHRDAVRAVDKSHFELVANRVTRGRHSLELPWYVPERALEPGVPCKLYVDPRLNLWAISDPSAPYAATRYWSFNAEGYSGWHDVPTLVTEAMAATLRAASVASLKPPSVDLRERKLRVDRGSAKP